MEAQDFGHWELIWKILFVTTLIVFSAMSVWVTIGGYKDLKSLLEQLDENDQEDSQ